MFKNFDFNSIKNFKQFVEYAKMLEDDKQRIEFLCSYFNKVVTYNYEQIFWGYFEKCIKEYSRPELYIVEESSYFRQKIKTDIGVSSCIVGMYKRDINLEEDSMVDKILKIKSYDERKSMKKINEINDYYQQVLKILMYELKKHTLNEEILNLWEEEYEKTIVDYWNKYEIQKGKIFLFDDITNSIVRGLENYQKWFPNIEINGMIKKGVCIQYAEFIKKYLDEVGIENYLVQGISELKHAWNIFFIDGELKNMDITREIFIRDNYGMIPYEQKDKWFVCSFDEMFKMQSTREIRQIDDKKLSQEQYITVENYNNSTTIEMLDSILDTKKARNL